MKKLILMLEDIFVAAAFAEAGVYETDRLRRIRPEYRKPAQLRTI